MYYSTFRTKFLTISKEEAIKLAKKNGLCIKFMKPDFKDDISVVLSAVKQNGLALEFASENLKNNKTIVFEALLQNLEAKKFVGSNLIKDAGWLQSAIQKVKYTNSTNML